MRGWLRLVVVWSGMRCSLWCASPGFDSSTAHGKTQYALKREGQGENPWGIDDLRFKIYDTEPNNRQLPIVNRQS
jgi:hypothetical protein